MCWNILDDPVLVLQPINAYLAGLNSLPGVAVIDYHSGETNNYQYIVVEFNPESAPLDRDDLINVLHAENVLARRYVWPGCHRMEPYQSFLYLINIYCCQKQNA